MYIIISYDFYKFKKRRFIFTQKPLEETRNITTKTSLKKIIAVTKTLKYLFTYSKYCNNS